jgi:hypothetical protein
MWFGELLHDTEVVDMFCCAEAMGESGPVSLIVS